MKVLMVNGSAKAAGCTFTALTEVGKALNEEGVDYEIFGLGAGAMRDCIGCGKCSDKGCIFDDDAVNEFLQKAREADGFVFGSPVYYAHPSGRILSFLDRAFCAGSRSSAGSPFAGKPGAAVVSARRGGTTASLDVLNKYFTIASMPVVSAASQKTSSKTKRASRPCAIWGITWRGCSNTCARASLRRRRAPVPTLSAEVIYVS